jgi:hypothetical protein
MVVTAAALALHRQLVVGVLVTLPTIDAEMSQDMVTMIGAETRLLEAGAVAMTIVNVAHRDATAAFHHLEERSGPTMILRSEKTASRSLVALCSLEA